MLPEDDDAKYFERIKKITDNTKKMRDKIKHYSKKLKDTEDYHRTNFDAGDTGIVRKMIFIYQTMIRFYDTLEWFEVGKFYNPLYEAQDYAIKRRLDQAGVKDFLVMEPQDIIKVERMSVLPNYDWAVTLSAALDTFY